MPTKLVPRIDAAGVYLGPVEADESPLEPGVWLIPAGCIDADLPDVPAGRQARYLAEGAWLTEPLLQLPPETPAPPAPAPALGPLAPRVVTMRQARLALLAAGLLDAVDAALAALPDAQRRGAQIEWEYAATVERTSSLTGHFAAALQLDDPALDDLFNTAAAL